MTDLRARLADALKQHQFWHANHSSIGSNAHCLCGLRPRDQSEWAGHVVADVLLSPPGIAIVDTEALQPIREAQAAYDVHRESDMAWAYADDLNSASREFVAALLAAADTAEEGS